MLIHITPRFITCRLSGPNCHIVDLTIPEIGLHLQGGEQLDSRRPYPNKTHVVGCKKVGQKAISGILIDTPGHVATYTAITRWCINSSRLVTHRVAYQVLDQDHDAVSDDMTLWYPWTTQDSVFADRWPAWAANYSPASVQPRMAISKDQNRVGDFEDTLVNGLVDSRVETFKLPTIERERLLAGSLIKGRLPTLLSAFESSLASTD